MVSPEWPVHARISGFIPGSEAHNMPTLISDCDQIAEEVLLQVKSSDLAAILTLSKRRMEMMQTLSLSAAELKSR